MQFPYGACRIEFTTISHCFFRLDGDDRQTVGFSLAEGTNPMDLLNGPVPGQLHVPDPYPSAGNCRRFSDTEEGSAKRCCINREIRRAREKPRPYALCGGGLTCCEWTQKVLKRCEVDDPVGNANAGL